MNRTHSYYSVPETTDFYGRAPIGLVELDPEIADLIKNLNAKGFVTVASCAGHMDDPIGKSVCGYIWIHGNRLPDKPIPRGTYICKKTGCLRWRVRSEKALKLVHLRLKKWGEEI